MGSKKSYKPVPGGYHSEKAVAARARLNERRKKNPPKIRKRSGLAKSVKDGGLDTKLRPPPKPKQGTARQVEKAFAGKCGAKTRGGKRCAQAAGFGTDHPGLGRCKYHGGASSVGVGHAVQERARLMGAPIDMNPVEAIIWSIRITAGEVKWLSEKIAELDEQTGLENTIMGKQFHLYVRERRDRVSLLYKMGNDALKLGLAERAIKMAEMYGVALSRFIMGVLEDLELTPEQSQRAPMVVRKHLIQLEGTKAVDPTKVIQEAIEYEPERPPSLEDELIELVDVHEEEAKQLVAG